jgi:hypothetical protein
MELARESNIRAILSDAVVNHECFEERLVRPTLSWLIRKGEMP